MDNIFDFIRPLEQILMILNRNGISVGDVKYILPYSEFLQMRNDRIQLSSNAEGEVWFENRYDENEIQEIFQ